jgi:hypothetical protein
MAKNKYYDFFNNYESLTETTKSKKLKKLSNNFDLNILVSLWNDYNKYLESKGSSIINNFDFVQLDEIESTIQVNLISNLKTLYLENDILKWKKYRTGNFTDSEVFANIELKEMINYQISQAYDLLIKSKETTTAPPQQNEIVKNDEVKKIKLIKPKKDFKDFFNPDVKIETIENIQKVFKDYEAKKLAILIYLLQSEFKLSTYSLDSKTDGRKHFAESLINKTISMQPINNCFVSHAYVLDIRNVEKDNDYINTKEKLTKAIV